MNKNFITVNEHIKFRKNGTASFEGEAFKKPESNTPGRWKEFEYFSMFIPQGMQWPTEGLYPTSVSHGKLKEFPNDIKVFVYDKGEEASRSSHPSPNKGKPLYDVTHLGQGGRMLKARKSGNIKLELPLLKNGQLADLGDLIRDLISAYYNTEWVLEAETLFPELAA